MNLRSTASLFALLPIFLYASAAFAQTANQPSEKSQAKSRPVLEEVMVSAQQREESLQDVPISVFALSGDAMAEANIQDMEDISFVTPNLFVLSHPPFTSINVRGLGSPFDKGFEASAGLFLDGVYVGRLAFLDSAFLDVAGVEILRGPQGTLFGKNTISGALSVRSNRPTNEFEGNVEWHFGARDYDKYVLTLNAPVTDNIALRGSFLSSDRDGEVHNTTLGRDEGSTDSKINRLQMRWDITDTSAVTLATTRVDQNFRLGTFQVRTATDEQFELMQYYDPNVEKDTTDYRSSQNYPPNTTQDGRKHDIIFETSFRDHDIRWINSYSGIDEVTLSDLDFSPIPLLFFLNGEEYAQKSTELRFNSPLGMFGGKLDYVGGIYFAKSETDVDVVIDAAPDQAALLAGLNAVPGGLSGSIASGINTTNAASDEPGERLQIDGFQTNDSAAIYGQATWHFSDELSLTAGLRYSEEKKTVNQVLKLFTNGVEQGGPVFSGAVLAEPYVLIDKRTDTDISPKLALNWLPTDDITLYASAAEGFKGGGYSAAAVRGDIAEVEPEYSITYEVGAKMRLLEGASTLNIAVFQTEFDDLQLTVFEGTTSRISNAAGALAKGAELEFAIITPWGISATLNAAYLDVKFQDFPNGPCPAGEPTPCDVSGKPLAEAPQKTGSIGLNYFNDLGDLPINAVIGWDMNYESDRLFQPDQDPIDTENGYSRYSYRIAIADDEERWSFQGVLANAGGQEAVNVGADIPTLTDAHIGRSIGPKEVTFTLRARF